MKWIRPTLIEGERIKSVGEPVEIPKSARQDAAVVDLPGPLSSQA
jgi:hypothetical protein